MGFRFRKSLGLGKGVRLNVGRRSASVSLGNKLFGTTVGTKGVRRRASLPGTGVSYTSKAAGCLLPLVGIACVAAAVLGLV